MISLFLMATYDPAWDISGEPAVTAEENRYTRPLLTCGRQPQFLRSSHPSQKDDEHRLTSHRPQGLPSFTLARHVTAQATRGTIEETEKRFTQEHMRIEKV